MSKWNKPVAGSRGYWPKKRARRIYPVVRTVPKLAKAKPLIFAGYKAGMGNVSYIDGRKGSVTQGQELFVPVTVVDCPPLIVTGIKSYRKTPYGLESDGLVWTETIAKDLARKTRLPKTTNTKKSLEKLEKSEPFEVRLLVHTKPRESGFGKKRPELFEVKLGGSVGEQIAYAKGLLGKEIKPEEVFEEGDYVDVSAVSTGKGYQGPVKRVGIKIRPRKHEKKRRHVGSLGSFGLGRVKPGKLAMAGQMGFQTRTEHNKRILRIGTNGVKPKAGFKDYGVVPAGFMLIEGSIPGPRKRLIVIRKAVRTKVQKFPVEIKKVII